MRALLLTPTDAECSKPRGNRSARRASAGPGRYLRTRPFACESDSLPAASGTDVPRSAPAAGDDGLSRDSRRSARVGSCPPPTVGEERLRAADADGDGVVDLAEFLAMLAKHGGIAFGLTPLVAVIESAELLTATGRARHCDLPSASAVAVSDHWE